MILLEDSILTKIRNFYKKNNEERKTLNNLKMDLILRNISDKSVSKNIPKSKHAVKIKHFSDKESNEIIEKSLKLLNKVIPDLKKIINNELNKSKLCKKYYKIELNTDDLYIQPHNYEYRNPVVILYLLSYSLWDIEPRARTDYDTSPNIKEAESVDNNIIKEIQKYCNKNDITIKIDYCGDWDDICYCIAIPVQSLDLSFSIKENSIFEFVELL